MQDALLRIAAFADGDDGGNPAGVFIADAHPGEKNMRRIAAEVGYSETAFAMPQGGAWRVRYFSPASEVPFCGHATIALGAALARVHGNGVFPLILNEAEITVEGRSGDAGLWAALQSPPTHSTPLSPEQLSETLALFGYAEGELYPGIAAARIHGGGDHFVLCLDSRERLAAMRYDLDAGRVLMRREGLITIMLAWAEHERLFHTRNPFASGGVYEDPATGAATAAFAGYLRDIGWPHRGSIDVVQGEDMGMRSRLHAEITREAGSSIRVSGHARMIEE
ncbi:MAG: PhzF family phenazine biosynthesis protein [Gammaproteobacteria bacterium]|nr:PhzF family phenazine biosynthesis protein [Gammaproteobacteria bacterium]MDH3447007.1 PhzF family phenazine biosynthesis protein [Gammaproteobacteria bacterium]